ncbi:MAG TPA: diguanylate cyclase [Steroidobacteraceae bacterium]
MPMLDMTPEALRSALAQLEQATRDHVEWHANLLHSIVCELPCDPHDLTDQAHRHCAFGQWLYHHSPTELRTDSSFDVIGAEHERVHRVATRALHAMAAGRRIDRTEFNELLMISVRLRRELDLLRLKMQAALRSRDELTGAYDRDQVVPELRRWRLAVSRGTSSVCIVFMDLDRLQEVNEARGYPVGDGLLAESVRYVRERLRPEDKVFRYGGDEFLITLPGTDIEAGRVIIGRIREGLAQRQLFVVGVEPASNMTASFGMALLDPTVRIDDCIERAAQALLLAKTAGGNRVIAWDASVTTGRHLLRLDIDEHQS